MLRFFKSSVKNGYKTFSYSMPALALAAKVLFISQQVYILSTFMKLYLTLLVLNFRILGRFAK
jgi:hypothetical protein